MSIERMTIRIQIPHPRYASRFNRATMRTLLMDVHRHEINISVMHSNLNVGRAEEENNFLKNHRRHTVSSEDKRRRIKNEKEKKEDVINVRNARTGCVMKRK